MTPDLARRHGSVLWLALAALFLLLALSSRASAETSFIAKEGAAFATTSWWLHLRSTAYAFQSFDANGDEQDRLGGYQHYDGSISGLMSGRLSFRASGRFADDLAYEQAQVDGEKLYVAYAQLRLRPRKLQLRVGRQFVQEGPTSVTLDGVWGSMELLGRWQLHAWGGARAPLARDYEPAEFEEDGATGVRLVGQPFRRVRVAASWAYREVANVAASHPVGFEITMMPRQQLRTILRGAYDLEHESWERVEFLGQWRPRSDWPMFSLQWMDRRPMIDAGSFFAIFEDLERISIFRLSGRHTSPRGFGAEFELFSSFVDSRSSTRIGGAFLGPHVRVGYSARLGDAGDESRFYGDAHWNASDWLELAGGAVFSRYQLFDNTPDDEDRELTTAFGRAQAELRDGLHLSLELQGLENPRASEDVRLLVGLDLGVGRGASNIGWQRGGWLR